MIYIVITIIFAIFAISMAALYIYERNNTASVREELDRVIEEKDIIIEFMHKTAEDISEGVDKIKLFRLVIRATALSCGAISACMYEKTENGKLVARAVEGLFPPQTRKIEKQGGGQLRANFLDDAISHEVIEANEGIIGAVASDGKGVLIKDAEKDPRVIKHGDDSVKIGSLIVVPVLFGKTLYGVLAAANSISGKSFSETDFSLAQSLGEQAGLALRNIEAVSALLMKNKMEFDLRLASSIQRYLLPSKFPDTDKLEFAVKYFPQQLIGGDFYDFFKLPDDRLGIVIGDVSGKGITAAIIMAICQTKLRYIAMSNTSPSETLKKLNTQIVTSMRTDMFITMVYAIVEADGSKITIARAGHEPPLLYKSSAPNEPAKKIKSMGMAVGMVDPEIFNEAISDVSADIDKGDIFVMYTDGVTESTNKNGEEFSSQKLAEMLSTLGSRNANDLNDEIIKSLEKFTNKQQYNDDLTLLSVKRI